MQPGMQPNTEVGFWGKFGFTYFTNYVYKTRWVYGQGNLIGPFRFPWVGSQKMSAYIR